MKELNLETDRLFLKPIALEHAKSYGEHFIDYEVIRNLAAQVPWPYPDGGIEDFISTVIIPSQNKNNWHWGLFLKENPAEMIGGISLWREGRPEHRGFWLGRKFWGKNLMTEAVSRVNTFAFDDLGFELLIFSNALGNIGSRKVKEKTGATFIEIQPAAFVDPEFKLRELWELSKSAWKSHTTKSQQVPGLVNVDSAL